mgnify:CR=1 FL=1
MLVNHSPPVRDLQDFSRILLALRMSLRGNFQQADWLLYFSLIMKMHEMSCKRLTYFKIVPNLTISHRLVIYNKKMAELHHKTVHAVAMQRTRILPRVPI